MDILATPVPASGLPQNPLQGIRHRIAAYLEQNPLTGPQKSALAQDLKTLQEAGASPAGIYRHVVDFVKKARQGEPDLHGIRQRIASYLEEHALSPREHQKLQQEMERMKGAGADLISIYRHVVNFVRAHGGDEGIDTLA